MWDINDLKAERIHRKITEMMALDYQPLSVINDVGFTSLLQMTSLGTKCLVGSILLILYCKRSRKTLIKISTVVKRCGIFEFD